MSVKGEASRRWVGALARHGGVPALLLGASYQAARLAIADGGGCATDGCSKVWESAVARPFGVALPVYGAVACALLLTAILSTPGGVRRLDRAVSFALGGLCLGVVGLQFYALVILRSVCPSCLGFAALVLITGLVHLLGDGRLPGMWSRWGGFLIGGALALGHSGMSPLAAPQEPRVRGGRVPAREIAMWRGTSPAGDDEVITFADPLCGGCRETIPALGDLARRNGRAFRIVWATPTGSARTIARLAVAAAANPGSDWLRAVFTVDPREAETVRLGASLGLSMERTLAAALDSSPEAARVRADVRLCRRIGLSMTPAYLRRRKDGIYIEATQVEVAELLSRPVR